MPYDELYDGVTPRPLYHKYLLETSKRTPAERKHALSAARRCIHGDADFLPLVRLMSDREYRGIVAGVRQRGRALRMFLNDHYFGDRSYERAGVLTKSQVGAIKSRYKVPLGQPALRPEAIQFWYAPDLIRDEDGVFRVIEDNIGFVGGMGDLEALADASRILGAAVPAKNHPRSFYKKMVAGYQREARRHGRGKTILLAYPKASRLNHEDERFENILADLGVESLTDIRRLKVREDGLYHGGERVGFVIVYVNAEKIEVPHFWQAVSKGQFGVSYSPGLEFVGDKNFCASVELLVKLYLKDDCLLPSLQTLSLGSARSRKQVRSSREKWVVKLGRGQSGESVWVGKHMTPAAWSKLMKRIAKNPDPFVAQAFCEPSQVLGHTVDLRPLAVITPRTELISPIPWARAAKNTKSKTNISRGGLLAPVAVLTR